MNPSHHTAPRTETGWRALLPAHLAGHWPLYAMAGTASLMLACTLAEWAAQPEVLALAIFLFTGMPIEALLSPVAASRGLRTAMTLACHAAALLWTLALAGALQRRRMRPGLHPA